MSKGYLRDLEFPADTGADAQLILGGHAPIPLHNERAGKNYTKTTVGILAPHAGRSAVPWFGSVWGELVGVCMEILGGNAAQCTNLRTCTVIVAWFLETARSRECRRQSA